MRQRSFGVVGSRRQGPFGATGSRQPISWPALAARAPDWCRAVSTAAVHSGTAIAFTREHLHAGRTPLAPNPREVCLSGLLLHPLLHEVPEKARSELEIRLCAEGLRKGESDERFTWSGTDVNWISAHLCRRRRTRTCRDAGAVAARIAAHRLPTVCNS